jgi:hypothetical protein
LLLFNQTTDFSRSCLLRQLSGVELGSTTTNLTTPYIFKMSSDSPAPTDKRAQDAQNGVQPTSIVASDSLAPGVLQRQGSTWTRGISAQVPVQNHSRGQGSLSLRGLGGRASRGSLSARGNHTTAPQIMGVPPRTGINYLRGVSQARARGGLFSRVREHNLALEREAFRQQQALGSTSDALLNNRFAALAAAGTGASAAASNPLAGTGASASASDAPAGTGASGSGATGSSATGPPSGSGSSFDAGNPDLSGAIDTSGTSMGNSDNDQPEMTIQELLTDAQRLGQQIDSARKPDSRYDYYERDAQNRRMTFKSELNKIKERFEDGDDSPNVVSMIKLFHHVTKQYENAEDGQLKNDLLYQKLPTTGKVNLSLVAISPLLKSYSTGREAWLDDGLIDFCVDAVASQGRNDVLYAKHHALVTIPANEAGRYRKVVCRHNVPGHWFMVSFIFPTKQNDTGVIEIRDSLRKAKTEVSGELSLELQAAAKKIAADSFVNCKWAGPEYALQLRQPNAVDCGTLTANGIVCQLLDKEINTEGLSAEDFCQSLRNKYLRWALNALGVPVPDEAGDSDEEMEEYVRDFDGNIVKVTETQKAQNRLNKSRLALTWISTCRQTLNDRGTDLGEYVKILAEVLDDEEDRLRLGLPFSDGLTVDNIMRLFPNHSNTHDSWYSETLVDSLIEALAQPTSGHYYAPVKHVLDWVADGQETRLASAIRDEDNGQPSSEIRVVPDMPSDTQVLVFAVVCRNHWMSVRAYHTGLIELYNSSTYLPRGLEDRIRQFVRLAFARINARPSFVVVRPKSPQQMDPSSCGPITVTNCVTLLAAAPIPAVQVNEQDARHIRLHHLKTITSPAKDDNVDDDDNDDDDGDGHIEGEVPPAAVNHIEGNRVLRYMKIDYRELLCNALEEGELTVDQLTRDVNEQLEALLGLNSYDVDHDLERRLEDILKNTGPMFAYDEESLVWSLRPEPWRSVSTKRRRILASGTSLDSPMEDPIDIDFDFGLVWDRHSWRKQTKPMRPKELKDAFHARFSPTNEDYTQIKKYSDYKRKTWYEVLREVSSSTTPAMVPFHEDLVLEKIMNQLNEQEGGADIFWLQSGFDGSSDAVDTFGAVQATWPNLRIKLVIVSEAAHRRSTDRSSLANGAGWLDHEHSLLAGSDKYSLMWTVLDMRRLVAIIRQAWTSDAVYDRALHAMMVSHYAKLDFRRLSNQEVNLYNPNFTSTVGHRTTFGMGLFKKHCHKCKAAVPFTEHWVRGPRMIGSKKQCAMYRLSCGRLECESDSESDSEKTDFWHTFDVEITAYVRRRKDGDYEVRDRHETSEHINPGKSRTSGGRPAQLQECKPCGLKYATNQRWNWVRHVMSSKHIANLQTTPVEGEVKWNWIKVSKTTVLTMTCPVCPGPIRGGPFQYKAHSRTDIHEARCKEQGYVHLCHWCGFPFRTEDELERHNKNFKCRARSYDRSRDNFKSPTQG